MKLLIPGWQLVLLISVLSAHGYGNEDQMQKENWIARLYSDLLKNRSAYDPSARPVVNHIHNTSVHLGLTLNHVDINDATQELSVNAWAIMTWHDEFLVWRPVEYGNVERLQVDQGDIWRPDISYYNSADGSDVNPFGTVPVVVEFNGQISWFPPTHIKVKCDLDLTRWPNDQHTCVVRVGSWAHHGEQIDLQLLMHNGSSQVMMDNFEVNNRWFLQTVESKRYLASVDGHNSFVELTFSFSLKRQAITHAAYVTQSTIVVIVVILASYLLPLQRFFSRLVMHLFGLAILIGCYFTLFSVLPTNGGPVPIIVEYYAGSMVLTTISLLATVFLCSDSPSSSASPMIPGDLGSKMVSCFKKTFVLKRFSSPEPPYHELDSEVGEDRDCSMTSANITTSIEATPEPCGSAIPGGSLVTLGQVKKVVNFILFIFFLSAYVVDYLVLRSVVAS